MKGGGAYNKHAKLQAAASASALPCWERSIGRVALEHGDQPIVIADYGSSQGKNSLAPMRIAQTWTEGKITYHRHGNTIYANDGRRIGDTKGLLYPSEHDHHKPCLVFADRFICN